MAAVSPTTYDGILTKTNPLSPGSSVNNNSMLPMLHHQLSTTSTIDTTFSLQDELLMSGDFGILNSNKSRRSSDCKFTQTVFEQEDHETFEEVLEHDLGEDESPFKKAKGMGPTYVAVVDRDKG